MLDLTANQKAALESGEPVPCTLEQTECIVVRKDIFERMQHVAYDITDWTPQEMIAMAEYAFHDADTGGPIE